MADPRDGPTTWRHVITWRFQKALTSIYTDLQCLSFVDSWKPSLVAPFSPDPWPSFVPLIQLLLLLPPSALIFCLNCGQQAVRDKALLREVFERYRGEHTTNEGRGEEGGVSTAPQNSDLITVNSDEQALTHEDIVLL